MGGKGGGKGGKRILSGIYSNRKSMKLDWGLLPKRERASKKKFRVLGKPRGRVAQTGKIGSFPIS